ncbi:hypothetical protein A4G19_02850 [Pasteurellaceae bacterium Macca]|nr:hypothetical protein [Pasteurellaceae bacterium Macca]
MLGIVGCSSIEPTQQPYQQITSIQQLPEQYRAHPRYIAPKGTKNGIKNGTISQGRTYTVPIKNGLGEGNLDIFYPNGQLHSRTPLVNGYAQGWSEGYDIQGVLKTKVLYKDSKTIRLQIYDNKGNLVKDITD